MRSSRSLPHFTVVAVLGAALLVGCREDLVLAPPVEFPFAIYGVLTPDLDGQSMLVYPVEGLSQRRTSEPLDATVTSTDLTTGESRVWRDSLTVDSLGLTETVFWSDFRARHGHRYRIEAVRSDGAKSHAEITVPNQVLVELDSSTSAQQTLHFRGDAVRLVKADITYTVQYHNPDIAPAGWGPIMSYTFPYWAARKQEGGGWSIDISMFYDHVNMYAWYALDTGITYWRDGDGIVLRSMELEAVVGDSTWNPPNSGFDPNVISHPEILDNVENGFGFVGGGYGIRGRNLHPLREAIENAGFHYVRGLTR